MTASRNVLDYLTLVAVRKRRGKALKLKLQEAQDEHRHSLTREASLKSALDNAEQVESDYADKMHRLTLAGRQITVDDLQGARAHAEGLKARCQTAREAWTSGAEKSHAALNACTVLIQQLRVNELRITSLDELAAQCRRALASAAEEREDEESSEITRR